MVHTVLKRAWYAETECESNLNCQRRILWRDWFVWQWKCRKWSIWRILLICLTSQLTHKSTICIFRDLLQLLWFRKRKKGSTLKLHPWNSFLSYSPVFWNNFSIKKMVFKVHNCEDPTHVTNVCGGLNLTPKGRNFLLIYWLWKLVTCLHSSNFTSNVVLE